MFAQAFYLEARHYALVTGKFPRIDCAMSNRQSRRNRKAASGDKLNSCSEPKMTLFFEAFSHPANLSGNDYDLVVWELMLALAASGVRVQTPSIGEGQQTQTYVG
jgi:hypothetical protein